MNKLELNDLHIRVLFEILEYVKKCDGCYDGQTSENWLRVQVASNILSMIHVQDNVKHDESMNDRMNKLELQVDTLEKNVRFIRGKELTDTHHRLDDLELNVKFMIGNGMLNNSDKINRLESLVVDLTTVLNKHSICGSDDK